MFNIKIMIKKFITNTYKWVEWITVIDSWKQGKNIWIFAITHGNEPVWLEVFSKLLNEFDLQSKLRCWKVYFIAINIEAYEKYLSSHDINAYRFLHHNMNRIYKKNFISNSYEFNRFKELESIFEELDVVIDLHSVSKWDDVIWLWDVLQIESAKIFFDVQNILVDEMTNSGALIWYFVDRWKLAFWLECWNHIWKNACQNWVRNVLNFLIYIWALNWEIEKYIKLENVLKFSEEIFPISKNFIFTRNYTGFTKVSTNEIYAIDNDKIYKNVLNEDIYLWLASEKIQVWDWVWFLFKKVD